MAKGRPLEVFILGVFNTFQKPMSGYELIKISKEWRFDHYIDASSNASFYYTLKKFKKNGFIEEIGSKQEENRPEKTIYKLLPKGREEFFNQMRYFLTHQQQFYFDIDAITPFILLYGFFRGKQEILELIEQRINQREQIFEKIQQGKQYVTSSPLYELNPFEILALDHTKLHNRAEIEWLKKFKQMVKETNFKKNIEEISKKMAKQSHQNK